MQYTPHIEAKDYDLYLITHKRMYFNQSNNAMVPILREIAHDADENFVAINTETARQKGIKDLWYEQL